jgi:hypothetical protein
VRRVAIALPAGLSFISHRAGGRIVVRGVRVSGGRGVSFSLSNGHLVITLRKPAASLLARLGSRALKESPALKRRARGHQLPRLFLSLVTANAAGRRSAVRVQLDITRTGRNAT